MNMEHGILEGGGLEFGQKIEECLASEIMEEYCTPIIKKEFLGCLDCFREIDGVQTHWVSLEFLVEVDREKVKNGEPHKFEELEWFRLDNLPTPAHSTQKNVLETFKDKLQMN